MLGIFGRGKNTTRQIPVNNIAAETVCEIPLSPVLEEAFFENLGVNHTVGEQEKPAPIHLGPGNFEQQPLKSEGPRWGYQILVQALQSKIKREGQVRKKKKDRKIER